MRESADAVSDVRNHDDIKHVTETLKKFRNNQEMDEGEFHMANIY
jgi:hypothetical protein